jgi:hypothetical protein
LPVPIDWFDRIREAARPSPIDGLVLTGFGAAAVGQSQAMAQQQAEAEVERRQRQLLWDEREAQRLAAVKQAKRMAAGYLLGTWVGTVVLLVIYALGPFRTAIRVLTLLDMDMAAGEFCNWRGGCVLYYYQ